MRMLTRERPNATKRHLRGGRPRSAGTDELPLFTCPIAASRLRRVAKRPANVAALGRCKRPCVQVGWSRLTGERGDGELQ
jgi:hypothetical protein